MQGISVRQTRSLKSPLRSLIITFPLRIAVIALQCDECWLTLPLCLILCYRVRYLNLALGQFTPPSQSKQITEAGVDARVRSFIQKMRSPNVICVEFLVSKLRIVLSIWDLFLTCSILRDWVGCAGTYENGIAYQATHATCDPEKVHCESSSLLLLVTSQPTCD